jgi:glycosyltransferase involved in cell wall biosynthesis
MRLLVITNNPDRASFRQRIGMYMPWLEQRGVRCQLARLPREAWRRRSLFIETAKFDAVFLHRKMLNVWDAFWLRRHGPRVLYDFDDAIMYHDREPECSSRARSRGFARSVSLASLVIAGNAYLAEHARRYSDSVQILPTGLDLGPYSAAVPRGVDNKRRIVWIGSTSTLPYLDEIRPVLEQLGRLHRDVVLRIICDAFFDLENMEVEKIAWSLETEAAHLLGSDIGLAPLTDTPFARGKCGFKILQYQAAALPVVASPVGVNAQYVRPGITGYHASTPSTWLEAINRLLKNPEQRESMGRQGRKDVEQFAFESIAERLYEIITGSVDAGDSTERSGVVTDDRDGARCGQDDLDDARSLWPPRQ